MKRFFGLTMIVVCLIGLQASAASAEEKKESAREMETWSVGAGFGIGYWSIPYGAYGGGPGMGAYGLMPFGTGLVERKISKRVNLILSLSGGYGTSSQNSDSDELVGTLNDSEGTNYRAATTFGVRYIFNPGGAVEVSGTATVNGSVYGNAHTTTYYNHYVPDDEEPEAVDLESDSMSFGWGGGLGLVFERELMDNLFLRFETNFLSAHWSRGTDSREFLSDRDTVDKEETKTKNFGIGLAFSPMIQLRLVI